MNFRLRRRGLLASAILACQMIAAAWPGILHARSDMTIGVLAFRGTQDAIDRWSPTASYLSERISGYHFYVIPLTLEGMLEHIEQDRLDFILTNTGNYVELENAFGISRLATLKARHLGVEFTQFGAVIFTRQDNAELTRLEDVAGHSMMAVSDKAFGGFQMAWRELINAGVDPFHDLENLEFSGFPQDDIVHAVVEGRIDVGTVRSGTLERMAAAGMIDIDDIRVLGLRQGENFPFLFSTRLYPEWPFAKARKTPQELAQRVAVALLEMEPDSVAATSAFSSGWTIPLDYGPVHELFRELKIGPYAYLSKPDLGLVWREYKGWILFSAALVLVLIGLLVLIGRANRRISLSEAKYRDEARERKQAQEMLVAHQANLEIRVRERTAELADVNASLRRSEATLRAIHDITADPETSFHQKLEGLLGEGCSFFDMAFAAIARLRDDRVEFVARVDRGEAGESEMLETIAEHMTRELEVAPEPIAIQDLTDHGWRIAASGEAGMAGAAVGAGYAIGDGGREFILFCDIAPRERIYPDVDIDILRLMAQWAAGEIERAEINRRAREHQTQLAHVARVNSMGEMATGIAHELNQPLTAILNYSSGCLRLLERHPANDDGLHEAIVKVGNDARRAAAIIKRLREFIKREDLRRDHFAIRDCIEPAVELLSQSLKQQNIAVAISYAKNVSSVYADRVQIEQVVVNLLLNAIDALRELDDREAEKKIDIDVYTVGGQLVAVAITDNGPALEADVVERLFDPFFSTKPEGMGMGLSISRTIVESHGGTIEYLLSDDRYPTIRFTLPLT